MNNYFGNLKWKGIFINNVIQSLKYSSYLELGVSTGDLCYNLITCENKVGVDLNPDIKLSNVICSSTDDYFNTLDKNTKFDLIFIDACHEKYQVYKDFCNSIEHLNRGGLIILHDIYPLSESYTSVNTWNGNVYETWIELVRNYPEQTSTFIGYPGEPEGTIGIFFDNNFVGNETEINYSYNYFLNNLPKYIYHKTLTEDQIILKAKTW